MESKWTIEKVKDLIKHKQEENLMLEFKSGMSIGRSDKQKKEISISVSAMANSNGGTIIYGMTESDHTATGLSFIDGNEFTKEWLEAVLSSNIFPLINDIIITPLRYGQDFAKSIYVIEVPRSSIAPHMALDKRYYCRYNFRVIPMEEYQVRRLYENEKITSLEIIKPLIGSVEEMSNPGSISAVTIGFSIKNIGINKEDNYKLQIIVAAKTNFIFSQSEGMKFTHSSQENMTFTLANKSSLFPGEVINVGNVHFLFNQPPYYLNVDSLNAEGDVTATVFFTGGTHQKKISLKELYEIANSPSSFPSIM